MNPNKNLRIQTTCKTLALATVYEKQPIEHWIHVCTDDGSAVDGKGTCVLSYIFQLQETTEHFCKNFDAELHAIFIALRAIENSAGEKIILFVDSQAAIYTITNYNFDSTYLEFECKLLISTLIESGKDIILQWIPSHCDVPGNERTDALAKEGCGLDQLDLYIPLRNIKQTIREHVHKDRLCFIGMSPLGKNGLPYQIDRSVLPCEELLERRRLRERYSKQSFQVDEVECKKLLVIYHATTKSKEPCGGICRRYGPPPSPKRRSPNRESPRSS